METVADWEAVEARLRELVAHNRSELFEPWREVLDHAPDVQAEVDRTVQLLRVFFNKWVVEIIIVLSRSGTLRFSEVKKHLDGISGRTLTHRLRDLEAQGIVQRTMYDEMPVRVEYALTEKGMDVAALALPLVLYLRLKNG